MFHARESTEGCLDCRAHADVGVPVVGADVQFTVRSVKDGAWSDPATWTGGHVPQSGDVVQVRAGEMVTYDVISDATIRMIHVAGCLTFARDRYTRLDVGLIKIQPGETASEDGFDCDAHASPAASGTGAALEVGTAEEPIHPASPPRIRLVYFDGTDKQSCRDHLLRRPDGPARRAAEPHLGEARCSRQGRAKPR